MALSALGADAADEEIKAYIREHYPDVPQSQIGLTLRKIRSRDYRPQSKKFHSEQAELFGED